MKNILITGGCGFVGTLLTNSLIKLGNKVTVLDTQWFGNSLKENPKLVNLKMDIRDLDGQVLENVDAVIHLANIANDPAVILNPTLSWEVNVLASQQLADKSLRAGVGKIIYASSGSVYGVKKREK